MKNLRKTTVAGMFYDQSADGLQKQIESCFTHKLGPGDLPKETESKKNLIGIIVPHAGLVCSGPFAAHAYSELVTHGFPDVCILIGPNHQGMGPKVAVDTTGEWETPLGSLSIDETISNQLPSSVITADSATLHQQENSLEVQLPFIKFLSNQFKKECSIVPMVMSQQDLITSKQVGEQLSSLLHKEKRNIAIIASSDFSHEGYSYGRFPPDGLTADSFARKQDKKALDVIQKSNPEELFQTIQKNGISMCGYGPVISLLTVAQQYPKVSVELLKYGTSYDTCSDSNSCVGYGALSVTSE